MTRPDPDQLLADVEAEEARARRGRLRIFFGSAAGVGKTYAMLEAAQTMRHSGTDVIVVGYVEPHGRIETERLLGGLERLPTLGARYRGIVRQELDLDAALKRRPAILLVDELAHSNLVGGEPPPRHPIVRAHGGEIGARARPGGGARVELTLPAVAGEDQA